jgi:DNA mismatch repair protein MutL
MGQALKQFPFTKEELEQKIDAEFEKRENSWEAVDRTNILYDEKTKYVSDSGLVFSKSNSDASRSHVINENDYGQNLLYEKKENELQNGYRIIGQLFNTYILCETKNSLYIIDQHAAHEKVNYERYVKQIKSKQIESTNLLTGFIITLTNAQMDTFLKYQNYFNELGFNIEEFGDREIKINSIPVVIGSLDKKEIFLEILDDLSLMPSFKDPEIVLDKIASMSCKAAIKGHDKLSIKEQEYLIDELLTLENPYNCPHGRPTIIAMTKYELEKKFKRIV